MHIDEFLLERTQSKWENLVDYNLTESGLHPLSIADVLTPEEIESLIRQTLGYGWTNGSRELRAAIASLYSNFDETNVVVTNGTAEANFLLVWTIFEPGDQIVVVLPNYMQIVGWARSLNLDIRTMQTSSDDNWSVNIDHLEKLVTPRTKLVSVCNPNNPTGHVMSDAEMSELVDFARRNDLYLHVDEVYKGAELYDREKPSFADFYEKALITSGMSKAMALPGLRIGWVAGPADIIDSIWHHKDYTSITTSTISELVATLALQPLRKTAITQRNRRLLVENLAILEGWMEEFGTLFSFKPPRAGGMAFVKYASEMNSSELSRQLRERHGVFVVAGDCFGIDGHIRIGIGSEPSYLTEALEVATPFFEGLAKKPQQ